MRIPYGQSYMEVEIPEGNHIDVFRPGKMGVGETHIDLKEPIIAAVKGVRKKIRESKGKICIVVSDKTRLAFNNVVLPILLEQLELEGASADHLTILVANGLHKPMTREELTENLGRKVVERYTVLNHVSDDIDQHIFLGRTSFGTDVWINRVFAEAGFKIATGLVEPHFFAGFSGGYKSILPGISSTETVYQNHSYKMIGHPLARAGVLEGNPVHEDIWLAGRMAGLDLIVNITVSGRRISGVYAGGVNDAYVRATSRVLQESTVNVAREYDVVITSNGGYPLDRNLYQAVKGMSTGEHVVREGGTIIIASECRDGVAHPGFQRLMEIGESPRDVLDYIRENEPLRDQWEAQILARIMLKAEVIVVSEYLDRRTAERMGLKTVKHFEEALEMAGVRRNSGRSVAVIPDGPYTIPKMQTYPLN